VVGGIPEKKVVAFFAIHQEAFAMQRETSPPVCVIQIVFEEMLADPLGTLESLFGFLGMDFMDHDGSKVSRAASDKFFLFAQPFLFKVA